MRLGGVSGDMQSTSSADPIRLSACLIVKDEETRLPECLASVAFCDELVVVDSGSSDRTVEIARAAGATVIEHPWQGFATERNVALDAARGEWALEVDADERITPKLRDEILALVADPPADVDNAVMPLRQLFLGRPLGPSAMYPAGRMRLFLRARYRHDDRRTVHEGLWPTGRTAYMTGDLEHLLAESLRESVSDLTTYSRLEAMQVQGGGLAGLTVGIVLRPTVKFMYRTWVLGGWHDGWRGMLKIVHDCVYDAFTWVGYARSRAARTSSREQPHNADGPGLGRHFGRVNYRGPARIAAVALGARLTASAEDWLEAAAREGADVVLITDETSAGRRVRTVPVEGSGVLALLRTISAEAQLNPIEALVVATERGRAAARLLPVRLRGGAAPFSLRTDPQHVIRCTVERRGPDR